MPSAYLERIYLEVVNSIYNTFHVQEKSIIAFLDMAKNVYTVDHDILLRCLFYPGIRGVAWNIFEQILDTLLAIY